MQVGLYEINRRMNSENVCSRSINTTLSYVFFPESYILYIECPE